MYHLSGPSDAPGGSPDHLVLRSRDSSIFSFRISSETRTEDPRPLTGVSPSLPPTRVAPTSVGVSSPRGKTGAAPIVAVPPSDSPHSLTASGVPPKGGGARSLAPTAGQPPTDRLPVVNGTSGPPGGGDTCLHCFWITTAGRSHQHSPGECFRAPQALSCCFVHHRGPPHHYRVCRPLGRVCHNMPSRIGPRLCGTCLSHVRCCPPGSGCPPPVSRLADSLSPLTGCPSHFSVATLKVG